jgi:hypothetical protein
MDRDQFFGNLFNENSENADAVRLQRQLAFEERIIKRVFNECGIKRLGWGKLANECREMTGHDRLNFNWFNSTYKYFPAVLCGRRIPKLHELTLSDLFKNPVAGRNRLCQAISKNLQRQEVDPSSNFIFVFPVVRTMFCAHNLNTEAGDLPRVTWNLQLEKMPMTVELTSTLFPLIGPEWASE